MNGKIRWNFVSQEARNIVFARLKHFKESKIKNNGIKDKEVLKSLFDDYNEYVSFKYGRPYSSMGCGSCTSEVLGFFQGELDKYEKTLKDAK